VERAQEKASGKVEAVLAQAKTFDAQGKEGECMNAVADAKLLLGIE
jgi:hypothetical protein